MKHKYSKGEADLQVMLHKRAHRIKAAILAGIKGASNRSRDNPPKVDTQRWP